MYTLEDSSDALSNAASHVSRVSDSCVLKPLLGPFSWVPSE